MRADLAHRWTLAELAQDAHLSPSRLGGLFVEQFGVPPIMLLARLRVREMARLLRESDMTVGEIGVRVGWRNRGHAAEQFAKIMGVTPNRIPQPVSPADPADGRRSDGLLVVRAAAARPGRCPGYAQIRR
ncbi:MAG: helix-turn-helix transcriptional regulator [Microbacterium hominis]|nr:helix-turn-helix transcriptional regulator [Microbacterium hominis]